MCVHNDPSSHIYYAFLAIMPCHSSNFQWQRRVYAAMLVAPTGATIQREGLHLAILHGGWLFRMQNAIPHVDTHLWRWALGLYTWYGISCWSSAYYTVIIIIIIYIPRVMDAQQQRTVWYTRARVARLHAPHCVQCNCFEIRLKSAMRWCCLLMWTSCEDGRKR